MDNKMIAYLRVSSDKQAEKYGLDDQRNDVITYCERNHFEIVAWLADDFTGFNYISDRPKGRELIDMLKAGRASGVVFPRIDRFGRRNAAILMTISELIDMGIGVHSCNIGLITDPNDIRVVIDAWKAEQDRADMIKRTSGGRKSKAKKGLWVGCGGRNAAPYGYKVTGLGKEIKIAVDPITSQIIYDIYNLYHDGMPVPRIAEQLNQRGIKPRRAKLWTSNGLAKILSNRFYLGQVGFGDVGFTDPNLQIIPQDLWDSCEARRNLNRKHSPKNLDYLVSRGRLECTCGSKMSGTSNGNGRNRYYLCWRATGYSKDDPRRCTFGRINANDVELTALMWLLSIALFRDRLEHLVDEMSKRAEVELLPLRERQKSIDRALSATSESIAIYIRKVGEEKDDLLVRGYEAELHRLSGLSKDLTTQREETQRRIDEYGIWGQGKVTADDVQIELCEVWGFEPTTFKEDALKYMTPEWFEAHYTAEEANNRLALLDFRNINIEKARTVIDRHDLRAQIVVEDGVAKLHISCKFLPKGETVRLSNDIGSVSLNVSELMCRLSDTTHSPTARRC